MASTTNGTREANGASRVMAFASAAAVPYDDPMSKVLGLDAKTSGVGAWFGFTSGSTALLVGFAVFASYLAWLNAHRPHPVTSATSEIEILRDEPPPPGPPKAEEEKPAAPPPPVHVAPREAPPPPPAPAQAAKVLTQEPDPNQPVDMTNTIVQGNSDSYAGGMSASNGTSTTAVHGMAAATGTPGSTGPVAPAPSPPGPDRSKRASFGGNAEWVCDFPEEADVAQVDDAYVTIQVDVKPDGTPTAARILADPGNGFGRMARRCAMNKRYAPALDHDGNPIAGTTGAIKVHFTR